MEKQQVIKSKFKKIKLTKKEATMLLLLGVVLIGWLSYRFIYIPQTEKLAKLAEERIEYEEKIDEINRILKKEQVINKEYIKLVQEKEGILSRYFPALEQSEMIYLINGLVDDERVNLQNMTFNRPAGESIGDFEVKSMDISMPYGGNYDGIMSIVKELRSSPKKILVDQITMDRTDVSTLNGSIGVKVYSLEGIADNSVSSGIIVEKPNNELNKQPFGTFDYLESKKQEESSEPKEIDPFTYITLMDFESNSSFFLPSQEYVKGTVSKSKQAKSNRNSLRFEYNILAIDEEKPNKAYIDVSRNKIELKYPPSDILMWVNSFDYSLGRLGLEFKTQTGEIITTIMSEGIGWTGWKQISAYSIPNDLSQYPLMLNSISLEIPAGREEIGVILIDKLEALYEKNLDEEGNDNSAKANYFYHIVSNGDTVEKISQMYYGNTKYAKEILSLNEVKAGEKLPVGKVMILKKRLVIESIFEEPKQLPVPEPAPKPASKPKATPKVNIDPNAEKFKHTVQKGETIYSISRKYYGSNSYAKEIMQLNGMKSSDVLKAGQVLQLIKR